MNPPVSFSRGFTLIEVLIGSTLLAMMMLLLTGSLRIGAESWNIGEERMAKASRLTIVLHFLRTHISSLLPVAGTMKNGQIEPAFHGSDVLLHYVAPLPEQVQRGGLYHFELYLAKQGKSHDLRMKISPYSMNPDRQNQVEPIDNVPIVENVKTFKISYLPRSNMNSSGGLPGSTTTQWVSEWQQPQLPALIQLDIEPEDEEPWPTLFIAPKTMMLR